MKDKDSKAFSVQLSEFSEEDKKHLLVRQNTPRAVIDEKGIPVSIIVHPDQYASMCDKIQDAQLWLLGIQHLTGITDPAKLSLEDFFKACGITDDYLAEQNKPDEDDLI